MFGGGLACGTLLLIAISFAQSDRQVWTFVYGPLAALFVPAVVASQVDTPRRRFVLRASTTLAVFIALASLPVDYGIPLLLAPSVALLAQAAGFIFQRGSTP